tara:strand:+ start:2529 stop:2681 length:153 start_codon:yes stop_codon:yes gene_type:complete
MGIEGVKKTCLNAPTKGLALSYLQAKYLFSSLTEKEYTKIKKEIYKKWGV